MEDFPNKTAAELLALHARIMEELRTRGILRSANNPTGDLAEYLFCKAFGWQIASNSEKGFDATGEQGRRIQIKGRRLHHHSKTRQLSAIRDLDGFDVLAAVLFDHDYRVLRAALIPPEIVTRRATYVAHTNSHRFMLRDDVWNDAGVEDVTDRLIDAMAD